MFQLASNDRKISKLFVFSLGNDSSGAGLHANTLSEPEPRKVVVTADNVENIKRQVGDIARGLEAHENDDKVMFTEVLEQKENFVMTDNLLRKEVTREPESDEVTASQKSSATPANVDELKKAKGQECQANLEMTGNVVESEITTESDNNRSLCNEEVSNKIDEQSNVKKSAGAVEQSENENASAENNRSKGDVENNEVTGADSCSGDGPGGEKTLKEIAAGAGPLAFKDGEKTVMCKHVLLNYVVFFGITRIMKTSYPGSFLRLPVEVHCMRDTVAKRYTEARTCSKMSVNPIVYFLRFKR